MSIGVRMTNNILITNHKAKECGVYQYGYHLSNILKKSINYNFIHCEIDNEQEYLQLVSLHNPIAIFYNFYGGTSPWINSNLLSKLPHITHYGLHHEGAEPNHLGFDHVINIDPTFIDNDRSFSIPRPLFENTNIIPSPPTTITVNSFGFPSHHKGFHKIVKIINDQFDEATINLHMPVAFFRNRTKNILDEIVPECYSEIKKNGIKLMINHDFMSDESILQFLSSSSLNMFLYDDMNGCGISSVIDYALSVSVPIAIRKSYMFRHIVNTSPSICIEDRSIIDIIESGPAPLQQYRDKWSNINLIKKCEYILSKTIKTI